MPKRPRQYQRNDKIEKAFAFFRDMERKKLSFTRQIIEEATGYTSNVVDSYISKKWHWFLIDDNNENIQKRQYTVCDFTDVPYTYFLSIHSQVALPYYAEDFIPNNMIDHKFFLVLLFSLSIMVELHFRAKLLQIHSNNVINIICSLLLLTDR